MLVSAVITDDIVAIIVIALFYSGEIATIYLILGVAVVVVLMVLNRIGVYTALPYAVCGIVLRVLPARGWIAHPASFARESGSPETSRGEATSRNYTWSCHRARRK